MRTAAIRRLGLDLVALSPREWRVSDPDRDERDGLSLLGFIEELPCGFEVTAIGQPGERTLLPDLDAALRMLQQGSSAQRTNRRERTYVREAEPQGLGPRRRTG